MEDSKIFQDFRQRLHDRIEDFLLQKGMIILPLASTQDIDDKANSIIECYLEDGVKEFAAYPMAALGWIMFIGMALAKMWDEDWERYAKMTNIYSQLRDKRGYDNMDEYIMEEILLINEDECKEISNLVRDVAQMSNDLLKDSFESGTINAFKGFVLTLKELYSFGAAMQLHRLGYKMTALSDKLS